MSQGYTYLEKRLKNSVLGFYSFNNKGRQGITKLKTKARPVSLHYFPTSYLLITKVDSVLVSLKKEQDKLVGFGELVV